MITNSNVMNAPTLNRGSGLGEGYPGTRGPPTARRYVLRLITCVLGLKCLYPDISFPVVAVRATGTREIQSQAPLEDKLVPRPGPPEVVDPRARIPSG